MVELGMYANDRDIGEITFHKSPQKYYALNYGPDYCYQDCTISEHEMFIMFIMYEWDYIGPKEISTW